jgi:hypothetical protein
MPLKSIAVASVSLAAVRAFTIDTLGLAERQPNDQENGPSNGV